MFLCSLFFSTSVILVSCSSGQTEERSGADGDCQNECVSGNCMNGTGTYTFSTCDQYTGEFENGLRNGSGTFEYANGDRYRGVFQDDKKHGQGTYTFNNGDVLTVNFDNGQPAGEGTYRYADGQVFEGTFQSDGTGEGVLKTPEGDINCILEQRKLLCETS